MLANFLTASIGTLVLLRAQSDSWPVFGVPLISVFAVYWIGFALLMFRGPFEARASTGR